MFPAASMFVRVSRRRSVTRLPFVVTELSTNVRDTEPLSFVVTEVSAVFVDMPFFSAAFAAPQPTSSVSAKASPQASMQ